MLVNLPVNPVVFLALGGGGGGSGGGGSGDDLAWTGSEIYVHDWLFELEFYKRKLRLTRLKEKPMV